MMSLVILSLFLTTPAPLEMPRAEAFLVQENDRYRLEDRYNRLDLWTSQAVVGRWVDDEGRIFLLADLTVEPPSADAHQTMTRTDYAAARVPMPRLRANRDVPRPFRRAIELLAGCPLTEEKPAKARQLPHGYADVTYWQHPTNTTSLVCAFRPEKSEAWHLAVWILAEGDELATSTTLFEDNFLRKDFQTFAKPPKPLSNLPTLKWPNDILVGGKKIAGILCERQGDVVIVGIGVNVNQKEFSPEIAEKATSLALLTDFSGACPQVMWAILREIDAVYSVWKTGFDELYPEIKKIDYLKGRVLSVRQTDDDPKPLVGRSAGILPDGSLDVGGEKVYAGEAHLENVAG